MMHMVALAKTGKNNLPAPQNFTINHVTSCLLKPIKNQIEVYVQDHLIVDAVIALRLPSNQLKTK